MSNIIFNFHPANGSPTLALSADETNPPAVIDRAAAWLCRRYVLHGAPSIGSLDSRLHPHCFCVIILPVKL